MAPAAGQMPQTRGDLEGLSRLAIEQIGAALGVPADLLFNGRFASKSTSQLSLVRFRFLAHSFTPRHFTPACADLPLHFCLLAQLNTTVSQLAKWVNLTLTTAYRDIYGEEDDTDEPSQMVLLTSPLSSTEEVINLYAAGLCPIEVAMPAALHAIGTSKDEIERVTKEAKERDIKKQDCVDCAEDADKESRQLANEEKKVQLKVAPERAKLELEQQRENLKQSKAAANKEGASTSSNSSK